MTHTSTVAIGVALMMAASPARPVKQAHYTAARDLQLAVMDGRLTDARDRAHAIANEQVASTSPQLAEVRSAARRIERSTDLADAGAQLGRLAGACGSCHEAADATLQFTFESAPRDVATPAAQMRRHAWAAERLWEGVIGPADASWDAAAATLASTPFDVAATVHEKPNSLVFERAEALREQAHAVGSAQREERATVYGQLMAGCAGCHHIVRPHPVARN